MGTQFRLVLFADAKEKAETAAQRVFARIDSLNEILSDYLPDSELNRLSKTAGSGEKVRVSEDLYRVLERAQWYARISKGAFDVTVGPMTRLWRRAIRKQALPESDKFATARALVNYKYLKLYPRTQSVKLKKVGMRLDLGGIAKGYAVESGLQLLKEMNIWNALLDGGGDVAIGLPPVGSHLDSLGWKIEVAGVDSMGKAKTHILYLQNCTIATSGDTFRFLEVDGKRYSHILNPHTGMGLTHRLLVTVIAKEGMHADAMASTASVLGEKDSQRLLKKYKKLGANILQLTVSNPMKK